MITKLSAPLFVQLELTEGCNHSCGYCSNPFSNHRGVKSTVEETKVALDEIISNKIFSVVLTGGEPFTNLPVLHYSLDRLKEEPIEVYVNTNLSQPISEEDVSRLKTADYVLVSFPSFNEERFNQIVGVNSFKKVLSNLEKIVSEGVHVGINQVVTPINYDDVGRTVEFLKEKIGINEFSASPIIPSCSGSSEEHFIEPEKVLQLARQLIEIEKSTGIKTDMLTFIPPCFFPEGINQHRLSAHGCSAGRDSVIIGANGEVRRCALLSEFYGNIRQEKLKTIWKRVLEVEKPINEKCNECMPDEYCAQGCEARARVGNGKDPFIKGLSKSRKLNLYNSLNDSDVLFLKRIMVREEGSDYLVGNGGSYVIGNESLVRFTKGIEGKKFSFLEVRENLGQEGINLVTYLVNRGVIKICNLE